MPGWSPVLSLAASGVASDKLSSACGCSASGSGASASRVGGVVSGVVELTDIGGSSVAGGSLILDAGGGTDIEGGAGLAQQDADLRLGEAQRTGVVCAVSEA